jgi:hypothetical protein
MKSTRDAVLAYLEAWNENDAVKRAALLSQCWAEDGIILNEREQLNGRASIEARIASFREQCPHDRGRLTSESRYAGTSSDLLRRSCDPMGAGIVKFSMSVRLIRRFDYGIPVRQVVCCDVLLGRCEARTASPFDRHGEVDVFAVSEHPASIDHTGARLDRRPDAGRACSQSIGVN